MDQISTIQFVKKYLEDIIAFFDLNLDVTVSVEDDIVVASYKDIRLRLFVLDHGLHVNP